MSIGDLGRNTESVGENDWQDGTYGWKRELDRRLAAFWLACRAEFGRIQVRATSDLEDED